VLIKWLCEMHDARMKIHNENKLWYRLNIFLYTWPGGFDVQCQWKTEQYQRLTGFYCPETEPYNDAMDKSRKCWWISAYYGKILKRIRQCTNHWWRKWVPLVPNYEDAYLITSSKQCYLSRRGLRMGVHDPSRTVRRKIQISLNQKEAT